MEKNTLNKLTDSLDKLLKFFTEKVETFEAVQVKDSDSKVEYASLEKGADVQISTASGSAVCPDGKYSLVNGVEFTVKDGKIDSIESTGDVEEKPEDKPAEELAETVEDPQAEDPKANEPKADDKPAENEAVKALDERVSAIESALKELLDQINAVPSKDDVAELRSELKDAYSKIQELSKIPTQFSADARIEIKESELEKYSRIADAFKK